MFKFIALFALVAAANAGAILAPTVTTQDQNILRSYGNLGQISTFSKTIDTPFSSVSKSDVRVSNPGVTVAHYGGAYAAPAYAAPAYASPAYAAPAYAHPGYATHAIAAPAYHGPAYHAPAYSGYAPAVAKVAAPASLLGVAYSAAPAVAHMTYTNGLGFNYAW